jgi:hypothetical protein
MLSPLKMTSYLQEQANIETESCLASAKQICTWLKEKN